MAILDPAKVPAFPVYTLQISEDRDARMLATVRELLGLLAAGGGHCTLVGTPEMISDEIELWLDTGAADGFNLMPPSLPEGLADFVELVIPELQRRGLFRTKYTATTLRGHLTQA